MYIDVSADREDRQYRRFWESIRAQALADAEEEAIMLIRDFPGLKIGHFNDYAGLRITFPANTSREDFERMKAEIQAALEQAELRGEQKALAFITGYGIPPVLGALHSKKDTAQVGVNSVIDRFEELLSEHPELTRGQAYMQAVLEAGDAIIMKAKIDLDG